MPEARERGWSGGAKRRLTVRRKVEHAAPPDGASETGREALPRCPASQRGGEGYWIEISNGSSRENMCGMMC